MDFLRDFPTLAPRDQARFKAVVTRLWAGEVIMPGSPMRPDPDWSFVERYHPLVASYLDFGDWQLDFRHKPPMARAVHRSAKLRANLNKFQSMVTLALRIAYHEQMGATHDREDCLVRVAELRDRLHQEGLPTHQLSARKLRDALRVLARHQLVRIPRGFRALEDEEMTVTSVMEVVLPENLAAYRAMLARYASTPDTKQRTEGGAETDAVADSGTHEEDSDGDDEVDESVEAEDEIEEDSDADD
ncbi:DUF4194 domain-containing protein [Myxococcus xanthus]|uniref:DUF4194 domain-containing protein n=1 Tax=Myxococcus xanthus TaxID=34 RepID=UPI0011656610|nr:DUF4194 domain-containing protein [Myxococcus xanthus]QDE81673.1 hypothetical protein BHS07_08930 [Myxococcus xanthus]